MREIAYPSYEIHRREHVEFMRKTAELSLQTMAGQKTVPTELLEYLKTWLVDHIMDPDMKIKRYLEKMRPA